MAVRWSVWDWNPRGVGEQKRQDVCQSAPHLSCGTCGTHPEIEPKVDTETSLHNHSIGWHHHRTLPWRFYIHITNGFFQCTINIFLIPNHQSRPPATKTSLDSQVRLIHLGHAAMHAIGAFTSKRHCHTSSCAPWILPIPPGSHAEWPNNPSRPSSGPTEPRNWPWICPRSTASARPRPPRDVAVGFADGAGRGGFGGGPGRGEARGSEEQGEVRRGDSM